jgi:hypothetical protein
MSRSRWRNHASKKQSSMSIVASAVVSLEVAGGGGETLVGEAAEEKLWSAAANAAEEGDRRDGLGACVKEPGRAVAEEAPVARAVESRITEAVAIAAESGPIKSTGGVSEMMPPGKSSAVVAAPSGWAMVEAVPPPEAPAATVTHPEASLLAVALPAFDVEGRGPAAPPQPGAPP